MDGLTHYIIPYFIGRRLQFTRAQLMASTFGGLFPDADVALIVLGFQTVGTWHGTITHSLPGLLAISILGALLLWRFFGAGQKWYEVVLPGLMGASTHTVLDMFNASRAGWRQLLPSLPDYPVPPDPSLPTAVEPLGYYVPYWENMVGLQPLHAVYLYLLVALVSLIITFWLIANKDYPWAIWIGKRGEKVTGRLRRLLRVRKGSSGKPAGPRGTAPDPEGDSSAPFTAHEKRP